MDDSDVIEVIEDDEVDTSIEQPSTSKQHIQGKPVEEFAKVKSK